LLLGAEIQEAEQAHYDDADQVHSPFSFVFLWSGLGGRPVSLDKRYFGAVTASALKMTPALQPPESDSPGLELSATRLCKPDLPRLCQALLGLPEKES
jgi:hypothetical protein